MKNRFLVFLRVVVTVSLCICLMGSYGCGGAQGEESESSQHLNDKDSLDDSKDYQIIKQNGKSYIVFDDISKYGNSVFADIAFESLFEMKDSVVNWKLNDHQKATIVRAFEKDEIGILTCDFDALMEPCVPSDCHVNAVYWGGEGYTFHARAESGGFVYIDNYTERGYDRAFQSDYTEFFNNENITITERSVTDDGKEVTYLQTLFANFMIIRYTLSDGDKSITVHEEYLQGTILTEIDLYCEDSSAQYVVRLYDLGERPSDAWLCQFDMRPYISD